jgi:hypothetical protein
MTVRAAKRAFSPVILKNVRNFTICSEPEACAIYSAKSGGAADILEVCHVFLENRVDQLSSSEHRETPLWFAMPVEAPW